MTAQKKASLWQRIQDNWRTSVCGLVAGGMPLYTYYHSMADGDSWSLEKVVPCLALMCLGLIAKDSY